MFRMGCKGHLKSSNNLTPFIRCKTAIRIRIKFRIKHRCPRLRRRSMTINTVPPVEVSP